MKDFYKIICAVVLPVLFNSMYNLSERLYLYQWQADLADLLVIVGVIGTIIVQTLGAYYLLSYFEQKGWIK